MISEGAVALPRIAAAFRKPSFLPIKVLGTRMVPRVPSKTGFTRPTVVPTELGRRYS